MKKNGVSAYYWLRMAEENSRELRQRTHALTEELKSKIGVEELETLEHSVMAVVEQNKLLTPKRPMEFIKRSTASVSLRTPAQVAHRRGSEWDSFVVQPVFA
jgi:hypothetical protein